MNSGLDIKYLHRMVDVQARSVATSLRKKGQIPKETAVDTMVHYMHQQADSMDT